MPIKVAECSACQARDSGPRGAPAAPGGAAAAVAAAAGDPGQVTQWLSALNAPAAVNPGTAIRLFERLFERLYDDLRRLARNHMRRENLAHTLSATLLAHEAWFRMAEQTRTQWKNRSHFLAVSSTMMRRSLVKHVLARRAAKRNVEWVALTLSGREQRGAAPDRDVVATHESLLVFGTLDARAAKGVALRFLGGLDNGKRRTAGHLSGHRQVRLDAGPCLVAPRSG